MDRHAYREDGEHPRTLLPPRVSISRGIQGAFSEIHLSDGPAQADRIYGLSVGPVLGSCCESFCQSPKEPRKFAMLAAFKF